MGMNRKQYDKWERQRRQGKNSFALKWGVLYWGVTVAIVSMLLGYFIFHEQWMWRRLIFNLVIFPIMGYFWGIFVWHNNEKMFHNYKANDS